ncbi:ABC transporter substrate-binding protein [Paenibacillus alkaliterrae]|uniref:ABC transporter substrate-binding protein n=1 Tax=Paenibacillus alkaliterrae TaxID=320909 RepID=UPI001F2A7D52|nr:ABC transporter substrate-binding protein [Paenibacillus alkaliterrae]MCF2941558.1 ABC transporter substrate-binding protein [Paenibacillus alkaliterrae]
MKKKLALMMMSFTLAFSFLTACGSNANNNKDAAQNGTETAEETPAANGEKKVVKIFQFKVEIADALSRMEKEYEAAFPNIDLKIETVGGGADYGAALKAKFASGDEPDIFNNGGWNDAVVWQDKMEDLSGEPWVANLIDATKQQITLDGKLLGMPMNTEGYGYLYNKALFQQAGITEIPNTLSELRGAAQKLKDAGITPFENGYGEWWILGIHNVNVALAKQPDPTAFVNGVKEGTQTFAGNPIFQEWVNLLDTTMEFGQKNPLTTDYNTQVTEFAAGGAAMMQQGNWTQVQIDGVNPDLDLGVLPMPINDDEALNDNIFVGVPSNWVVNNKSSVKQEAKDFLNWMATSDAGKRYTVEEFKFIPAFTNIPFTPEQLGDIAASISEYSKAGKTLPWIWAMLPDGTTQEFGASIQAYVGGKLTKEQLLQSFDTTVQKLLKK